MIKRLALTIFCLVLYSSPLLAENPEGMIHLPSGTFWMGSDIGNKALPLGSRNNEGPAHQVTVDSFWIDIYPVTNAQYAKFVKETGYVTYSEVTPDPKDWPGAKPEMLFAGSIVFKQPKSKVDMRNYFNWWELKKGANWRHPTGPDSSIEGKDQHPVVHVTYKDAESFCKWAGKEIPTEAQFEYAARGGFDKKKYSWGDQPKHFTEPLANLWQGKFPYHNENKDGYLETSPVGSFPPNGYGLYDISGNVWEWVSDWYHPDYFRTSPKINPKGVKRQQSYDPNEPGVPKRIVKGGSFLCSENYCTGYRPSARMATDPRSSSNHNGFRCVKHID
jgi:formylglycine-generating enzyme required for sulfatase activity